MNYLLLALHNWLVLYVFTILVMPLKKCLLSWIHALSELHWFILRHPWVSEFFILKHQCPSVSLPFTRGSSALWPWLCPLHCYSTLVTSPQNTHLTLSSWTAISFGTHLLRCKAYCVILSCFLAWPYLVWKAFPYPKRTLFFSLCDWCIPWLLSSPSNSPDQ